MNKFFLVVIGICYSLAIVGFLVPTWPREPASRILSLAENVGLLMMLIHGTLPQSRLFYGIVTGYMIMRIGWIIQAQFKEPSVYLIVTGHAIILVTYIIHFIRKPVKQHLDILKLVTIVIFCVETPVIVLNLLSKDGTALLSLALHVIFLLTFADFVFGKYKAGDLLTG
jgi:hypothetical protein